MTKSTPTGPYHTAQSAATYLDYSYDRFRLLARKHQIPRRGPGKNRFAQSDLDHFMIDPEVFLDAPLPVKPKKRKTKTIPM
jgi:hypothetical protein